MFIASNWFEIKKTKLAETTVISLWRGLENHILPVLGHRPIDKITAPETIKTLEPHLKHQKSLICRPYYQVNYLN